MQALSCFGRVVGEIRHGFVKASNGSRIGIGVRFCSFIKTVPKPSYVPADSKNVFFVRHDGQIPTWRQCGQSGHQVASCPTKQPRPAYPYAAALSSTSPRTRAPEANSENQMKNSHKHNQDKQASEPALSSSDVDARQKQDTLERQQDLKHKSNSNCQQFTTIRNKVTTLLRKRSQSLSNLLRQTPLAMLVSTTS